MTYLLESLEGQAEAGYNIYRPGRRTLPFHFEKQLGRTRMGDLRCSVLNGKKSIESWELGGSSPEKGRRKH